MPKVKKEVLLDGRVTLYLGDSVPLLNEMKPTGKQVIVSDPPYGINYKATDKHLTDTTTKHDHIVGDDKPFDPSPLLRWKRLVLWGGHCFASRLPDSSSWMVWDKTVRNGMDRVQFAEIDFAWCRGLGRSRAFRYMWSGALREQERHSKNHPTQKPIALMKWCIKLISKSEDDIIIDPYMGSGGTGVAAVMLGRTFIGMELVDKYYKIARKRILDASKQRRLF